MNATDPLAPWRKALDATPILTYPLRRPGSTLMGVAHRLGAVLNYLSTLDADHSESGLVVANIAVDYTFSILEFLRLESNDGPMPPIINLEMARLAIANLRATVRGHLEAWQQAAYQDDDEPAEPHTTPNNPSSSNKLVVDRSTFTVTYKDKSCFLGNKRAFWLLERCQHARGTFLSIKTLIDDVWKGKEVSDEAVQRQISTLRTTLKTAGIDGIDFEVQGDTYRLILA
jgi:hypothetical protein